MATLREEAQAFVPKQTLNIADLDKVPVGLELKDGKGTDKAGEEFQYKYIIVDGKEYRVPGVVLGGIKALLQKMPSLTHVSVMKQGSGKSTTYQVVPII